MPLLLLLTFLLAGCVQELVLGESDMTSPDMPAPLASRVFAPVQLGMWTPPGGDATRRIGMMLTDVPGRLACLALEDTTVLPEGSGAQIWLYLSSDYPGDTATPVCPVGEFVMVGKDHCLEMLRDPWMFRRSDAVLCAVFRQWSADGVERVVDVLRSGLVTVRGDVAACEVRVEVIEPEGTRRQYDFTLPVVSENRVSCSQ